MTPPHDLDWSAILDRHEAEIDADIAEDAVPRPSREQAMQDALALISASGRASRYAAQHTGCWMSNPVLYRRIYRWVMSRLTGERL